MTELSNGQYAYPTDELTALRLEGLRRGLSYGQLVAATDLWEQQQIIRDYCECNGQKRTSRKRTKKK